ncbi:hypothetical protein [Lachnoclostridium sp. Marseille-P6806]|uniref:hypothetical protein n=1 Tax=Lachnoclostridium sp. Marseille-P6806 TaxID=2364793 RepID=UPI0013EF3874|nr:hypothetical protein [Lachnoclostridium sp. Marseille-P6806]
MKKAVAVFWSVFLAVALAVQPVHAESPKTDGERKESAGLSSDDSNVPADGEVSSVPDDIWDGEYTEFKGPDGQVTTVFDSGSVVTEYSDGSVEGVDYRGNRHFKDSEGNYTVRTTDGESATEYKDGRRSYTDKNGITTCINTDGSSSETYENYGLVIEYDAEGERTGIGFVGSNERITADEDGDFEEGAIRGPNGASLTYSAEESHMVTVAPSGRILDYTISGSPRSKDGLQETLEIKDPDGTHSVFERNTTAILGADRTPAGTRETTYGYTATPDGDKYEHEWSIVRDKGEKPTAIEKNVQQWNSADGSTLWFDGNSHAMAFRNPTTGETMVTDSKGRLVELKTDAVRWNASYDEDGDIVSADFTDSEEGLEIVVRPGGGGILTTITDSKEGIEIVSRPDGSGSFTTPEGVYTSDGEGNVFKDGVQIKKDGEFLPGYETYGKDPEEKNTPDSSTPVEQDFEETGTQDGFLSEEASEEAEEQPEAPQTDEVGGTYSMTTVDCYGTTDTFPAKVVLYADGSMEIRFAQHMTIIGDDFSMSLDMEHTGPEECLKGTFDQVSNTFIGMGNKKIETHTDEQTGISIPTTSFWNMFPTKIKFDPSFGSASGSMAEGEVVMGVPITMQITMKREGE